MEETEGQGWSGNDEKAHLLERCIVLGRQTTRHDYRSGATGNQIASVETSETALFGRCLLKGILRNLDAQLGLIATLFLPGFLYYNSKGGLSPVREAPSQTTVACRGMASHERDRTNCAFSFLQGKLDFHAGP